MGGVRRAEVLVAGVGGCGASALYHLARRGVRAIGLDRFDPGHDRGSSHGDTRVIRKAYFEHPDYVPLLHRAYDLWRDIENDSGEPLLDVCGLLLAGPEDGAVLTGARLAARLHGARLDSIERPDLERSYPWFELPAEFAAAWEPDGGYLRVEDCVRAYARQAVRYGASICAGEAIHRWLADENGVRIETETGVFEAERLVLSPGPWLRELLPEVTALATVEVLRKVLLWYPRKAAAAPVPDHTYYVELPYGGFYGFPCLDGETVKVAEHTGGDAVADPLAIERGLRAGDTAGPGRFVAETLPGLDARPVRHAVCMYTMTADGHFLLDRLPDQPNVVVAAGFSGHGFKFMSAIGAILCELAVDGRTDSPIEFLGLGRFAERGAAS